MLKDHLSLNLAAAEELNKYFASSENEMVNEVLRVVEKYGTPEEINRMAMDAKKLPNLLARLKNMDSPYLKDLEWLTEMRDKGAFISVSDYRRNILGAKADSMSFNDGKATTLEISALQYFPWLIEEAKQAIDRQIAGLASKKK